VSAPGKIILLGEHAVVYGRPAIAVPVSHVRAEAQTAPGPAGDGLTVVAPDLGRRVCLADAEEGDPLAVAARLTLKHLGRPAPDAVVTVTSAIPIAGGMGSGAAVSSCIVLALATHLGAVLTPDEISGIVFEVEKIYHGTPSGIDNSVIVHERPIYYVRGEPIQVLSVGRPICLLVADSGVPSSTADVVADVRRAWEREPAHHDVLFDQIGELVEQGREALERGSIYDLGPLMDENHELLVELGVSSPELEDLAEAARFAGALGAKLSGAGRGGNVIAVVEEHLAGEIEEALLEAGAGSVITTVVD
jgi:mevalonate kinase